MSNSQFFFVEMGAGAQTNKPFDGMRTGEFMDMYRRKVAFNAEEMPAYLSGTLAAIDATRTEGGEIVGLPIDMKNHEHGDAAGWIVGAELSGDTIRLTPKWTQAGLDLIGAGLQRFFSPSVDMENKAIIGGSLTNWPATRAKGRTLLRPIELADGEYTLDEGEMKVLEVLANIFQKLIGGQKSPDENPPEPAPEDNPAQEENNMSDATLAAQPANPQAADLEFARLVDEKVNERLAELQRQEARQRDTLDFSERACNGVTALPVTVAELSEALLSLPEDGAEKVKKILDQVISAGLVNLSEKGHSGQIKQLADVPAVIKPYLVEWVKAGKPAADFFDKVNPELGKSEDFNLSEFAPQENK